MLLNATVIQLVVFDRQAVNFVDGVRYFTEKPDGGQHWGLRFAGTFVF